MWFKVLWSVKSESQVLTLIGKVRKTSLQIGAMDVMGEGTMGMVFQLGRKNKWRGRPTSLVNSCRLLFLKYPLTFCHIWLFSLPLPISSLHICHVLSCVWHFETPWTVVHQAPLSIEFSRQEYWSGLPFPPPADLPASGIRHTSPVSPALQADSLPLQPSGNWKNKMRAE